MESLIRNVIQRRRRQGWGIGILFILTGAAISLLPREPIFMLISLALVVAGGASIAIGRWWARPLSARRAISDSSPVVLGARKRRLGIAAGMMFWAILWNGFVWALMIHSWRDSAWFIVVFLCLFVAVGLAGGAWALWTMLGLLNPNVIVTLNRRELALGETLRIDWQLMGRSRSLRSFHLMLEGVEETTGCSGGETANEHNIFISLEVVRVEGRNQLHAGYGTASITIPCGTMPSWKARHNKITWHLRAHGVIPRWPDMHDRWGITVLPLADARGGGESNGSIAAPLPRRRPVEPRP